MNAKFVILHGKDVEFTDDKTGEKKSGLSLFGYFAGSDNREPGKHWLDGKTLKDCGLAAFPAVHDVSIKIGMKSGKNVINITSIGAGEALKISNAKGEVF